MSGHTPGPWSIVGDLEHGHSEVAAPCHEHQDCGKTIVFISSGGQARPFQCSVGPHRDANALLIAAAPDLYDALNGMVGLIQLIADREPELQQNHRFIDALAAIAKAEGR